MPSDACRKSPCYMAQGTVRRVRMACGGACFSARGSRDEHLGDAGGSGEDDERIPLRQTARERSALETREHGHRKMVRPGRCKHGVLDPAQRRRPGPGLSPRVRRERATRRLRRASRATGAGSAGAASSPSPRDPACARRGTGGRTRGSPSRTTVRMRLPRPWHRPPARPAGHARALRRWYRGEGRPEMHEGHDVVRHP